MNFNRSILSSIIAASLLVSAVIGCSSDNGTLGNTAGTAGSNAGSSGAAGQDAGNTAGTAGTAGHDAGHDSGTAMMCGGLAGIECPANEFCDFGESCGAGDQMGMCKTKSPDACPEIYSPVCGCDDKDYSTPCEAAYAGVSIAKHGTCESASIGESCGGLLGASCSEGEYCNFGKTCGAGDQSGICEIKSNICPGIFAPVCGCDGNEYSNACEAAAAGVSVDSDSIDCMKK